MYTVEIVYTSLLEGVDFCGVELFGVGFSDVELLDVELPTAMLELVALDS